MSAPVAGRAATIRDAHETSVQTGTDRTATDRAANDPASLGVKVPATSANLGPGYDALGIALDVPLVAVAGPRREARVTSVGLGAEELPDGDDNLIWRAVVAWCAHVGASPPDISIRVDSAIPLERGMGSSSAAAVAGLVLARAMTGGTGSARDLLRLATDLEGHPDNAAAAIVGGLVLCLPDGSFRRVSPDGGLRPILLIPTTRQNTAEARNVLDTTVSLDVAAANAARSVATFMGLAGHIPLRATDMVDELHEPQRLALMSTSGDLVDNLRSLDIPAALSGAGPSVLVVVNSSDVDAVGRVSDCVRHVVSQTGADVEVLPSRWDLGGAELCPPTSG